MPRSVIHDYFATYHIALQWSLLQALALCSWLQYGISTRPRSN